MRLLVRFFIIKHFVFKTLKFNIKIGIHYEPASRQPAPASHQPAVSRPQASHQPTASQPSAGRKPAASQPPASQLDL